MSDTGRNQDRQPQSDDLIKYQTYANALVKLNNATNTLLRSGANEEAIKYILQGTNILFEELTQLLQRIDNKPFISDLIGELNREEDQAEEEQRKSDFPSASTDEERDRTR